MQSYILTTARFKERTFDSSGFSVQGILNFCVRGTPPLGLFRGSMTLGNESLTKKNEKTGYRPFLLAKKKNLKQSCLPAF